MVSTVTVSSVTTVTTVTSLSMMAVVSLVAIISLVSLLVSKELVAVSSNQTARLMTRYLNVGVVPLLMVFTVIASFKVVDALI